MPTERSSKVSVICRFRKESEGKISGIKFPGEETPKIPKIAQHDEKMKK